MGLLRTEFMPLSIASWTYLYSVCPLLPIISGCSKSKLYSRFLIFEVASHPFIPGMFRSMNIRSKLLWFFVLRSCWIMSKAFWPLIAVSTFESVSFMPNILSKFSIAIWLYGSSSTIRIFFYCFFFSTFRLYYYNVRLLDSIFWICSYAVW